MDDETPRPTILQKVEAQRQALRQQTTQRFTNWYQRRLSSTGGRPGDLSMKGFRSGATLEARLNEITQTHQSSTQDLRIAIATLPIWDKPLRLSTNSNQPQAPQPLTTTEKKLIESTLGYIHQGIEIRPEALTRQFNAADVDQLRQDLATRYPWDEPGKALNNDQFLEVAALTIHILGVTEPRDSSHTTFPDLLRDRLQQT